ncbi:MAG: M50 family metallopeptidase, partial [Verrucomicrobia bacterium]|nr:M50 family metallopeptidase [Verrucomicrobiota bacterium]
MIVLPGNIPLYINPSFWLLSLFIGYMNGATPTLFVEWVIVVFVSVLVHELGHALTALLWGQRARIELGLIGGVTIRQGPRLSNIKEFFVVLMGPLFGLFLALGSYCLLVMNPHMPYAEFFDIMVFANVFWT